MSIKGSSKKLKIEKMLPVFAVFTTLAVALRLWQTFTIIEPDTGFYKTKDFTVTALYVVLAVASLMMFFIAYLSKKVPQPTLPAGKNVGLGIMSAVVSVSILVNATTQISGFLKTLESQKMYYEVNKVSSYLMKNGTLPRGIEGILAIISAIYFLLFALRFFGVKINIENRKVLAVIPVFWATARMIQRFTRTISFIFVSDLLLELFMIGFLMLFLLYFAQFVSKVNSRHVMNKVYAYGLISAMFALVISVPKIAVAIVLPSLNSSTNPLEICNVAIAVFILVLCCVMLKVEKEDNITLKEAEKLKEERKSEE